MLTTEEVQNPPPESWVSLHVRAPQTDWCPIIVNQFGDFSETLKSISQTLSQKYPKLKLDRGFNVSLVGGGLVQKNEALMHGDKLIAIPFQSASSLARKLKEK
jgi:hypothetical protein